MINACFNRNMEEGRITMIKADKVAHEYFRRNEEGDVEEVIRALDGVSMEVKRGEFIAVLGANGSGKSTLARHLNALLVPTEGTLWIGGIDTRNGNRSLEIRKKTGMVFQNPDNQIISNVVEEDVGFGPENLGIATEDIIKRVDNALKKVGMFAYRKKSPNRLSGGQKQRVAVAGILAMEPECIVLDEATAMLDPVGRDEVMETVRMLNKKEGVTLIVITHFMEEALLADRIFVMSKGKVVMSGTPGEVFSKGEKLKEWKLAIPQSMELIKALEKKGMKFPEGILNGEDLIEFLGKLFST